MRDMVAFRAVALGVVADDPEFVGDAGGQGTEADDGDRGGGRGAADFGDASRGSAERAQARRVFGPGGEGQRQGGGVEGGGAGWTGRGGEEWHRPHRGGVGGRSAPTRGSGPKHCLRSSRRSGRGC